MRVAALYDVHGNLPALEATLRDVATSGVVEIVVGGDVLWGPFQVECVMRLRDAGATFIRGNCERNVLHPESEIDHWCAARLDDETRALVSTWPLTVVRELDGLGTVVFCHATPRDDEEILTRFTPDDAVQAALADAGGDVVVCGHTHVQFDRSPPGSARVVNAGSVGLPYEGEPGARWLLIGDGVEHRRTPYDVDRALAELEPTGFPAFADVFVGAMRGTTSAEEATAHFESRRGA
jgi:diadenosine tetraphosphatase ApaH/serine/threonine PP2A family protein phosphatase